LATARELVKRERLFTAVAAFLLLKFSSALLWVCKGWKGLVRRLRRNSTVPKFVDLPRSALSCLDGWLLRRES
jgi:hypothetical protein